MKRKLLIALIFLNTISSYSQVNSENVSFEMSYPIPIGNNFINKALNEGYIGLIDLGVDYNVYRVNRIGIGLTLNSSILRLSETDTGLKILDVQYME